MESSPARLIKEPESNIGSLQSKKANPMQNLNKMALPLSIDNYKMYIEAEATSKTPKYKESSSESSSESEGSQDTKKEFAENGQEEKKITSESLGLPPNSKLTYLGKVTPITRRSCGLSHIFDPPTMQPIDANSLFLRWAVTTSKLENGEVVLEKLTTDEEINFDELGIQLPMNLEKIYPYLEKMIIKLSNEKSSEKSENIHSAGLPKSIISERTYYKVVKSKTGTGWGGVGMKLSDVLESGDILACWKSFHITTKPFKEFLQKLQATQPPGILLCY